MSSGVEIRYGSSSVPVPPEYLAKDVVVSTTVSAKTKSTNGFFMFFYPRELLICASLHFADYCISDYKNYIILKISKIIKGFSDKKRIYIVLWKRFLTRLRSQLRRKVCAQKKARYFQRAFESIVLEHFKIFCSSLGRREDKAGKEDYAVILKYCE
jgi:hypothetical protein